MVGQIMEWSYKELELQVTELPAVQKQELLTLITHQLSREGCISLLNDKQSTHRQCPHCHATKVKKYGVIASRQRFRCNVCQRTFMSTVDTPLYRLRKIEQCVPYLRCLLDSLTVRASAARCGMNKSTAFQWRHRFLRRLTVQKETRLAGIVEMDETLFRYSEKGSRELSRPAHKRGRDKAGRGRKKGDWVPVLIARDRENHVFDNRLESEKASNFISLLKDKLSSDSVVCSDSFWSYKVMCQELRLAHKAINLSKGIRVIDKVFHIQNINGYHARLHNWIARFHGVATKYLDNYLAWRRFFETHTNPNENSILLAQTQLTHT